MMLILMYEIVYQTIFWYQMINMNLSFMFSLHVFGYLKRLENYQTSPLNNHETNITVRSRVKFMTRIVDIA